MLPAVASRRSAASATVRARGPMQVRPLNASASGQVEIRPRCGLRPTRPVQAAGIRIDPAPSDPSAAGMSPAATAAAAPPLEPPGVWCGAPGIAGRAERGPLGERPLADLRGVGLADHDRARLAQPPHHLVVAVGGRTRAATAVEGRVPGEVEVFLDRGRHPEQRRALARGDPAVRGVGLLECLLGADHPERVEVGLGGLGATQRVLDQLPRGDAAGPQHPHLLEKPEGGGVRWVGAGLGRHRSPSSRNSSFERTISENGVGWARAWPPQPSPTPASASSAPPST